MWEYHGNLPGESGGTIRYYLENVGNVGLEESGDARSEGEGESYNLVHEGASFIAPSYDVRV